MWKERAEGGKYFHSRAVICKEVYLRNNINCCEKKHAHTCEVMTNQEEVPSFCFRCRVCCILRSFPGGCCMVKA